MYAAKKMEYVDYVWNLSKFDFFSALRWFLTSFRYEFEMHSDSAHICCKCICPADATWLLLSATGFKSFVSTSGWLNHHWARRTDNDWIVLKQPRRTCFDIGKPAKLDKQNMVWTSYSVVISDHRRNHPDTVFWFRYGSIPIDTFLVGWTSIYQLFWGSLGTRVLTHPHLAKTG